MRKILFGAAMAVVLTWAGESRAAFITGSFGVTDFYGGGSFTSSSLTLTSKNLITTAETGTFTSVLPTLGDLTAYSSAVTGLSSTPITDNINNFFVFSTPDSTFGTSGTTPNNRFDFNLASIQETSYTGSTASFTGWGTLVDTAGTYANSLATFTLSFSGQGSYSFTFASVPEPAVYGACAGALALLPFGFRGLRSKLLRRC